MKYNPAFLSDEELIESFVVRHTDLDLIINTISENVTESNQHVLVIGSRGSGKTTLVRRVAAEMHNNKVLKKRWYPLIFAEESYEIVSAGEFWLEALFHIGQQTKNDHWKQTYEELKNESNEKILRERALAQLMDFADNQGKRILLIVENLNMLLQKQMSDDDAWALRHTLLNESRIMFLATATPLFEQIENSGYPMFELFKVHELKPLDNDDCRAVWTMITGIEPPYNRIRPLQILTGGSPRFLTIISKFGAKLSLKELMDELIHLVDDHTEYFKSQLDNLPAIERKVFLALADLWDPVMAKDISMATRLTVNKTSSLLNRLIKRRLVNVYVEEKKSKWYQVSERIYNIYYLMRRHGASTNRVKAVVKFMISFYGHDDLVHVTQLIAEEACRLSPELCEDHYLVYETILKSVPTQTLREKIVASTPRSFFESPNIPSSIKHFAKDEPTIEKTLLNLPFNNGSETIAKEDIPDRSISKNDIERIKSLLDQAIKLSETPGKLEEAELVCRKIIKFAPDNELLWTVLGSFLFEYTKHYEEAETAFRKAIEINQNSKEAWAPLGQLLHEKLERYEEAEQAYRKVVEIDPNSKSEWSLLAQLLQEKLERYEEAEQAYRKTIEIDPKYAWAWGHLGQLLHLHLERYQEAEQAYRKALELKPDTIGEAWTLRQLGQLLHEKLERYGEAEVAYSKSIEIDPGDGWACDQLALLLHRNLERYEDAEKAYRKAIEINPNHAWTWGQLGQLYHECLNRYEDAEKAYRKAIEVNPNYAWAWANLGRLYHEHLKLYEEAEKLYHKSIELEPGLIGEAWTWGQIGKLYHDLDRYEDAEKAYCRALEIKPDYGWAWLYLGQLFHEKLERYEEAEKAYRKASEINPHDIFTWACLGKLLVDKLERFEDAEKAYRKIIDIEPEDVWAWGHLGSLLQNHLGRYKEAKEAYRKVIDMKPENAGGWALLAQLSHYHLELFEEAKRFYLKAIELETNLQGSWQGLIVLILKKFKEPTEALHLAKEYLRENSKNAEFLNFLAWSFYMHAKEEFLDQAEIWIREALTVKPDNANYKHTLACILSSSNKSAEALILAEEYLVHNEAKKPLDDAVQLFVELAAAGHAQDALRILQASSSVKNLEPLVVGLRLFLDEDVKVAIEIREIAKDIVKKIKKRQINRERKSNQKDEGM